MALLAVIWTHFGYPPQPIGYLALETFFVLSGYLITRQLAQGIALRTFYANRVRRLGPALVVMVVVTFALRGLLPAAEQPDAVVWVLAPLSLTAWYSALQLGWTGTLAHTWSLSVEETFYLVWPLALLMLNRLRRPVNLPLVVACAGVADYVLAVVLYTPSSSPTLLPPSGYLPPLRFGGILLGCALALQMRSGVGPWLSRIASVPALPWLLLAGAVVIDSSTGGYGRHSYLVCLPAASVATVLVIVRSRRLDGRAGLTTKLLSWYPLRTLGVMSYSIYLWHYFVTHATRELTVIMQERYYLPLRLLLILAVGAVSFYLLERPYLQRSQSRRTAAAA